MKQKLKIAVYSGDVPSTTFIERLINGLSNSGHQVYLFGFIKSKLNYSSSVSVFAYRNTKIQKALFLLKYSLLLFLFKNKEKSKLDHILKRKSKNLLLDKVKSYPVLWHKPDVFHVQWAKGLKDWMWLKDFDVKVVLSLRGAHINYSPIADLALANTYRELFPHVNAFHAVSKAIAYEAEAYGAQKEKIKVVYSGLDLDLQPTKITIKNNTFKIVSVGRPHWIKGYTYALDACKLLKDQGFDFKYTIIGADNDIELLYQVHDLGLHNEVELLNQMPFSFVQDHVQHSDLLLLSSLKEGIANVVLEAMTLETIVLSTDCGGIHEVISTGDNGFLTPIRNSKAMANKIIEISALPEEKKRQIRANALETVKNSHSEKQMVDNMLTLYETL